MLIINEKYAIKNDGLCYNICVNRKRKGKMEYEAKWYFNTLSQAICFLADRVIDHPKREDDIEGGWYDDSYHWGDAF